MTFSTKRYAPVNCCIYCDRNLSIEQLTDEHIIPYGLNGQLLLPKSSCHDCSRITGAIVEQEVLRKMFIDLRTHKKMRSRKPKDRPTQLRVFRFGERSQRGEWESLPLSRHPYAALLPIFGLPSILYGGVPRNDFQLDGVSFSAPPEFHDRLKNLGPKGSYVQLFHPEMYTRMLAKIAHSYATAELGYGNFQPFLKDVILGNDSMISHYVGGSPVANTSQSDFHALRIDRSRGYVDVHIQLFAENSSQSPTYLIVAGR